MTTIFAELAERLRGEVADIEQVVAKALHAWEKTSTDVEQTVYLDAIALNLHSFYSGLERLFELIARHLDGAVPESETWHRDLLQQMKNDVAGVRPALIDPQNAERLDEFRRFRHLVRNIYTTNLSAAKMAGLLQVLPELWPTLKDQLLAFADFLEYLADNTLGQRQEQNK